jgi:phosphoribosylglycinamide formyltransferase-1
VSGNGTTLQSIIDSIANNDLNATIKLIVTNNKDAFSLERAKQYNIPYYIVDKKSSSEIELNLLDVLQSYPIDLILLAGYNRLIGQRITEKYQVINTHPSLLPKFGGKGMYGMNVHRAVIEANEKLSGTTVHYVNENYDDGEIIEQTIVEVLPDDTPKTLCARVQVAEKKQLIRVLKSLSINFKI